MLEELSSCRLCPRGCEVDRLHGKRGFCGAGKDVKIARAALHYWEEPCLSGEKGSGTVFFSYCHLKCVFCQNYEISAEALGQVVSIEELADIFLGLESKGAHNINLVSPTHYVPQIKQGLIIAKDKGLSIPIVYNSSGYESLETLKLLRGYIDIYLPDFKYFKSKYALEYSKAPDYVEITKKAIREMVDQVGTPRFNEEGIMTRGVIIRHLMLPYLMFDSKKIVNYIHEEYGEQVYMSIMNQYTPLERVENYPRLNRKIDPRHYDYIIDYALELGVENGFFQEGDTASESFIPPFKEGL